jgi:hypothetical protein
MTRALRGSLTFHRSNAKIGFPHLNQGLENPVSKQANDNE